MNFDWTESEQAKRGAIEALFTPRTVAELDSLETADLPAMEIILRAQLRRLGDAGYLPADARGAGGDAMGLLACQEVVALASSPLFLAAEASARLFGGLVALPGGESLDGLVKGPISRGEAIGAVARADAEDGQPTRARIDGQEVVLDGAKAYVTNGPFADWLAVLAQVDGEVAAAIVPGNARGLERGERLPTLGLRGLAVCPVVLEGVRIPRPHLLGPFEDPAPLARLGRQEDLALAVCAAGIARRAFEAAKAHASEHQRGGKPVVAYQAVRFKLAELLTLVQTAELACRRAAWLVADLGGPDAWEADTVVRCAKVFSSEAAERVSSSALQIMAGRGYTTCNPVERAFRDSQYPSLSGTTSTRCRMDIADAMLERYVP
ncbi:MAG: acyl-CoA dehydrogenase [Polyangia bacterium]|jgi:alkylation response protein AidB-like acyl-CoA dehydrogenase|nr:acyl-CoA dehydrogenase [Polyangia bacterium]